MTDNERLEFMSSLIQEARDVCDKYSDTVTVTNITVRVDYDVDYDGIEYILSIPNELDIYCNRLTDIDSELYLLSHKNRLLRHLAIAPNKYDGLRYLVSTGLKVIYQYDFMGMMEFVKVNNKSITAVDITGKKHYLKSNVIENLCLDGYDIIL
jgi:hypothetical protein